MDVNWPWFLLLKLIVVLAVFSTAALAFVFHPGTFPSPEQRKVVLIISLMTMTIEIFFIYQQHDLHRDSDRANNDPYIDQSISITTLRDKTVLKARDHVVCFPFDFGNKIKNFTFDATKRWMSSDRNLFDRQWRWILLCQIIGNRLIVVYISMFFCFFFFWNIYSSSMYQAVISTKCLFFMFYWHLFELLTQSKPRRSYWIQICISAVHTNFIQSFVIFWIIIVVRFDLYSSWAFRC